MEDNKDRNEIYSQRVRAGKRTYFFDVRETRSGDHYITITESKKKFKEGEEGFYFEKHKIFLYKEDFEKFSDALNHTVGHIEAGLPEETTEETTEEKTVEKTVEATAANTELSWD